MSSGEADGHESSKRAMKEYERIMNEKRFERKKPIGRRNPERDRIHSKGRLTNPKP